MNDRCEVVLAKYTAWLNKHHAANGDTYVPNEKCRVDGSFDADDEILLVVKRADYDEYEDSPIVLADGVNGAELVALMCVTPYHDEGGYAELVAWVDENDVTESGLAIRHMIQHFDMNLNVIIRDYDWVEESLPR